MEATKLDVLIAKHKSETIRADLCPRRLPDCIAYPSHDNAPLLLHNRICNHANVITASGSYLIEHAISGCYKAPHIERDIFGV